MAYLPTQKFIHAGNGDEGLAGWLFEMAIVWGLAVLASYFSEFISADALPDVLADRQALGIASGLAVPVLYFTLRAVLTRRPKTSIGLFLGTLFVPPIAFSAFYGVLVLLDRLHSVPPS